MSAIDKMLAEARRGLDRVQPEDLDREIANGALVIDIRPEENRRAEGTLPGAIILERNVLEWRLDPTSPDRVARADRTDLRVVIFCNDGYASSLAAHSLQQLGLERATDLDGGYRAWRRAEAAKTVPR